MLCLCWTSASFWWFRIGQWSEAAGLVSFTSPRKNQKGRKKTNTPILKRGEHSSRGCGHLYNLSTGWVEAGRWAKLLVPTKASVGYWNQQLIGVERRRIQCVSVCSLGIELKRVPVAPSWSNIFYGKNNVGMRVVGNLYIPIKICFSTLFTTFSNTFN